MAEVTNQAEVDETLEFLPDEAKAAFRGERGEWSEGVTTIEGADAWFNWCDDCSTYHQCWYVREYEVTKGVITVLIHDVDRDGNWDICDSYQVGTKEMETLELYYGVDAWHKQYKEYIEHVANTGDDPCCEFMVKVQDDVKQEWTVRVFQDDGVVGILNGRVGRGKALTPEMWPPPVRDYFLARSKTPVPEGAIVKHWVMTEMPTLDDLAKAVKHPLKKARIVKDGIVIDGVYQVTATVEYKVPRAATLVTRDLKKAAKKSLERERKRWEKPSA